MSRARRCTIFLRRLSRSSPDFCRRDREWYGFCDGAVRKRSFPVEKPNSQPKRASRKNFDAAEFLKHPKGKCGPPGYRRCCRDNGGVASVSAVSEFHRGRADPSAYRPFIVIAVWKPCRA